MLRVRLDEARPGMALARAITHQTQPGLVLLRAGVALNALSIARLRQIGITHVWIEYPGLEELARLWDPQLLEAGRDCVRQVARFVDSGLSQQGVQIDVEGCRAATTHLARSLRDAPAAQALLTELESTEQPSVLRIGMTTVLSLLLGLRLDYYLLSERSRLPAGRAKDVTPLGLGAMLHDVGLVRTPEALAAQLDSPSLEALEADTRYQAHTINGFTLLRGKVEPAVAAIVLHHHQHFDGTGSPKCRLSLGKAALSKGGKPRKSQPVPLTGKQIHVFARIVHVAQLAARLTYSELGTQAGVPLAQTPVRVLQRILSEPFRSWCDPEVLRALLRALPAFPLGSIVTLSDGRRAAVVAFHELEPCRPTVETITLLDPKAKRERLDLRLHPELSVVAVDGQRIDDTTRLEAMLARAA